MLAQTGGPLSRFRAAVKSHASGVRTSLHTPLYQRAQHSVLACC